MKKKDLTLSFVGLGKLGLALQASFSSKKFNTIGYDIDANLVNKIRKYKENHQENGILNIIRNNKKFKVTSDLSDLFSVSRITFITLPTPSLKNGRFSLNYLFDFFKNLKDHIGIIKSNKQIFVIVSTINPGDLSQKLSTYISKNLKLNINSEFYLAYNPEFIALGSVINDLFNADFVLIGSENKRINLLLKSIYLDFYGKKFKKNIFIMSPINAELAKIAFNAFTTMKITFANQIGLLAKKNTQIKPNDVLSSIGTSKRISNHYFQSGLPYSGPCFPRDNIAYSRFFNDLGVKNSIPTEVDKANKFILKSHLNEINKIFLKKTIKHILIVGSSYKENTPVIDHSFGEKVIQKFHKKTKITIFDFKNQKFLKQKYNNLNYYNNFKLINLKNINLVIIAHKDRNLLKFKNKIYKIPNIYDPWSLFKN